jgi:hypothetical protein
MKVVAQKIGITSFVAAFYLWPLTLASIEGTPEPITIIDEPVFREVVFDLELTPETESESGEIIMEQSTPGPETTTEVETIVAETVEVIPEPVETSVPAPAVVATSQRTRETKKKRRNRRSRPCLDHIDSIVHVSNTRYRVEKAYVNSMARHPNEIRKLGHASWHRDDEGEIVGFRVRRIRCGSPLHQAGFRNGDIIHTVNGRSPRTVVQAIALWFKMRKKTFVRVVLTRNGEELKFRYRLT